MDLSRLLTGTRVAKPVKMSMLGREPKMNSRLVQITFCLLAFTGVGVAQTAEGQTSAPPVSYTSITELNQLIGNLEQTSMQIQQDLSNLRVERWKTDSGTKRQTQSDIESIQRNLQFALPAIVNDLKASPESTPLTFKLYRNLDALYDVFSSVVESAGAFGAKDEFRSLDQNLGSLEASRRAFADRMDKIATAKETEISQLRTALQTARAEIPPKKVIVDDTEPASKKKPVNHKKTTKPPAKPQPQTAPPPQSQPQ
jgi:hypothetical protein